MNEILRRALFRARLSEEDVAAHLGVDPKTVRRWLEGRVPYPRYRQAMSHLLGADEADLWPEVHAVRIARSWPEEIKAVYPHRWAVPHEAWHQLFDSAHQKIDILAYNALFLVEDARVFDMFSNKARAGTQIRIALGDPSSPHVGERGAENASEGMAAKIRSSLALYGKLSAAESVELRLHSITLYSSLYRADNDMFVNQHAYGIPASNAPVIHLRKTRNADMFSAEVSTFERIWATGRKTTVHRS